MKHIIIATLLLFSAASFAQVEDPFLDLVDETRDSVVLITHEAEDAGPEARSLGTGFVVEGGYIVTNYHVIDGAEEEIKIYIEDQFENFTADVRGYDEILNLAVLRVNEEDFPEVDPLQFRTDSVRPGQTIWNIGHPRGLQYSITKGIVSHVDRRNINPWAKSIQTDAAINPGNSGGPMLDLNGDVAGVNTMIISSGKDFAGVSLAIDGIVAERAIKEIIKNGKVNRPRMGVVLDVDNELFKVIAGSIQENSAAWLGGMKSGDIYVSMDDMKIRTLNDVFDFLSTKKPDDVIHVNVIRDGEPKRLAIKLGSANL